MYFFCVVRAVWEPGTSGAAGVPSYATQQGAIGKKQPANTQVSLLKYLTVVFEGSCKDGASVTRMQDSIHKAPALLEA